MSKVQSSIAKDPNRVQNPPNPVYAAPDDMHAGTKHEWKGKYRKDMDRKYSRQWMYRVSTLDT